MGKYLYTMQSGGYKKNDILNGTHHSTIAVHFDKFVEMRL